MWRRPRLVGGGWVRRAESRWWFRVAVRFGSPWRHPFLRTGEDRIRLFKHFNTCEYYETSGKMELPAGELAELLLIQIARHRNDFSNQRGGPRGRPPPSAFAPPAAITHRRPCPGGRAT